MKNDFFIILDNIRSAQNVGAIFRTAESAGVTKIFLSGITPNPPRHEIEKTALGATLHLKWQACDSTETLARKLQKAGTKIVVVEQSNSSIPYTDYSYDLPLALILGNEISGVGDRVQKIADTILEIPLHGHAKSLNVATTAGIIIFKAVENISKKCK